MLLQNKNKAGRTLTVSSSISESNKLILDDNGCVEVTAEAGAKLLCVPGFEEVQSRLSTSNPPLATPKELEKKESEDDVNENLSSQEVEKSEDLSESQDELAEPKEGDTKLEDGKAYVYRMHGKTGVLGWFRDQEKDQL